MARRRRTGRDVHGIVLIDKPAGHTSNRVLQQVKRLFQANKAGHTGSLDPLATGVLPICFGHATKISAFLLDSDKAYRVEAKLGVSTDTGDSEGATLEEKPVPDMDRTKLLQCLEQFKGSIQQVPPMYSALKHQGKPLYELARSGIEVERQPRRVLIYDLQLIKQSADRLVLDVHCSKGTYVRSLVMDIGTLLGCGAHVTALRRRQAGPFVLDQCVTLDQLEAEHNDEGASLDAYLLPTDAALQCMPMVQVSNEEGIKLQQGQSIEHPTLPDESLLRLYVGEHQFIGIGRCLQDGRLAPHRMWLS